MVSVVTAKYRRDSQYFDTTLHNLKKCNYEIQVAIPLMTFVFKCRKILRFCTEADKKVLL